MRDVFALFAHLVMTILRLCRPGGVRAVIAESLLLKQQLLIVNRGRQRAPNLRAIDRLIVGAFALFIRPGRIVHTAVVLRPSTILGFTRAGAVEIPPRVHADAARSARTAGTLRQINRSDRGNEAPESTLGMPADRPAAGARLRPGD